MSILKTHKDTDLIRSFSCLAHAGMKRRDIVFYERLRIYASNYGGRISFEEARACYGSVNLGDTESLGVMRKIRETRVSMIKEGKQRRVGDLIIDFKNNQNLAGVRSTARAIGRLEKIGFIEYTSDLSTTYFPILIKSPGSVMKENGLTTHYAILEKKEFLSASPNKKYGKASAVETEKMVCGFHRMQKRGVSSKIDRKGAKEGGSQRLRIIARNYDGESSLSLASSVSKVSKSTVSRHRKVQRYSVYNKSVFHPLKPGVDQFIFLNNTKFFFDVPSERSAAICWGDELNRSKEIGFKGKFIAKAGFVGVQTTTRIKSTSIVIKRLR